MDHSKPMDSRKRVIVRTYRGSQASATAQFQADAVKLAAQGYFPTSQSWAPGSYGCGCFVVAVLLCFLLIGILIFIYMLIVKPAGTLSVTYELRNESSSAGAHAFQNNIEFPSGDNQASGFDQTKWNALLRYDKDIAAAADQLRPYGLKWTNELAAAYMAINEKSYLAEIVVNITERVHLEKQGEEDRLRREEEKREIEQRERERMRQQRRDQYIRLRNAVWGTSQRRIWTTILAVAVIIVIGIPLIVLNDQYSAVDNSRGQTTIGRITAQEPEPIHPSFDCAKVHSEVLKLICATPDLAKLDQELAAVYVAALFNASSPHKLKIGERVWIAKRNNSTADVTILEAMYKERIAFLRAIAYQPTSSNARRHSNP
jgi:uncharacterized protein YecT (DUF1311 family)